MAYDHPAVNHEKSEILAQLNTGFEVLRAAVEACPSTIAAIPPGPDKWSVLDCLEHLVLAEEYLCRQLAAGTPVAPSTNEEREARILAVGADRSRRIPAPDVSHPTGRWRSIPEAMNALVEARARTSAFVERFEGDLRGWQARHPIAGMVNGYEMLLMIAVHPLRHAQQIYEIRTRIHQAQS